MNARLRFYKNTISAWLPQRHASILVVAGGLNDRDIFRELKFSNVTISNVDKSMRAEDFSPCRMSYQDAEALSCPDQSFDYVVAHAGLHHCFSPHRALLEMYRVARSRIVVIEPCDNFTVRLMQRLGLSQVYEQAAVYCNSCQCGGVANTTIPNFIYRWTEQDVEKTISAYAPFARHGFRYAYGLDEPCGPLLEKNRLKRYAIKSLMPVYRVYALIFAKQRNLFAFMVEKPQLPQDLHPWLVADDDGRITLNAEWGYTRFK